MQRILLSSTRYCISSTKWRLLATIAILLILYLLAVDFVDWALAFLVGFQRIIPYQPVEERCQINRTALEQWLAQYARGKSGLGIGSTSSSGRCANEAKSCNFGAPCQYSPDVDFRIIVIAYDRACSLEKSLRSIERLDLDTASNTRVSVDIWLDVSPEGILDEDTDLVARTFAARWTTLGRRGGKAGARSSCVHVQKRHAYIGGQWINTWTPPVLKLSAYEGRNRNEIALILEDDVDISPHVYKWLKAVHDYYENWSNISGFTLQMENTNFFAPDSDRDGEALDLRPMQGRPNDTTYLYPVLGTWGFSPHPRSWKLFQNWYAVVRTDPTMKPYVPGIRPTRWYRDFERTGKEASMWEMWHIYFTDLNKHWCVYPNLLALNEGRPDVLLSSNRKEDGLHYYGQSSVDEGSSSSQLLKIWNESYVANLWSVAIYSYDGRILNAPASKVGFCGSSYAVTVFSTVLALGGPFFIS